MAYVITQSCCNDASCTEVCPVNAIHPLPQDKHFARAEMLYIDPATCINCAACVEVCPVSAIYPQDSLPTELQRYAEINAAYFLGTGAPPPPTPFFLRAPHAKVTASRQKLRVAIVGTGPSGIYAAEHLLKQEHLDVEIDFIEKLPTPFGLARFGIAPDHAHTREAITHFKWILNDKRVRIFLNTEVGVQVQTEELSASHHAVIYAVGAMSDRLLDIPGEALPGSHSATEFVAWYNGHPDYRDKTFNLSGKRAIVIGNGNVALDVARILLLPLATLKKTDMADHAIAALAKSRIEEVVVAGRRGVMEAAYSNPELLALSFLDDIDVILHAQDIAASVAVSAPDAGDNHQQLRLQLSREIAARPPRGKTKRLQLRYQLAPLEIFGDEKVESVRFAHNRLIRSGRGIEAEAPDNTEDMTASLVLRSVGYLGTPIAGLPFAHGKIPNTHGRVTAQDHRQAGVYTVGWIKRGATGVMGSNKHCAAETVDALLQDMRTQQLTEPVMSAADFSALLKARQPALLTKADWQLVDAHEISAGREQGRPRVKLVDPAEILSVARHHAEDKTAR